jgi:flavodoxin
VNALIICYSHHHFNTQKIATVIGNTINAEMKNPTEVNPADLLSYKLIGFGSGIYFGKHHRTLLQLVDKMPQNGNQQVFIFSTSGQEGKSERLHKKLRKKLQTKGYNILGEFNCPGYDTYLFTKLVGGLQKGRPNEQDLKKAQAFAENLKQTYNILLLCDTSSPQK